MNTPKAITERRVPRRRFLKRSGAAGLGLASLGWMRLAPLSVDEASEPWATLRRQLHPRRTVRTEARLHWARFGILQGLTRGGYPPPQWLSAVNDPLAIRQALDRHLDHPVELVSYGRAALAFGFPPTNSGTSRGTRWMRPSRQPDLTNSARGPALLGRPRRHEREPAEPGL
jgi:hypothetical protein